MKHYYIFFISFLIGIINYSQTVIVRIDRTNGPGPTAVATAENLTAVGLTRGEGLTQGDADGIDTFRSRGFLSNNLTEAIAADDYLQVSASAISDYNLEIVRIRLQASRGSNGPTNFAVLYSFDDFSTSNQIGSGTLSTTRQDYTVANISLKPPTGGTITFRLYAWGATNSGTNSDLIISGNGLWGLPSTIALPGITMSGSSTFDGLVYTLGAWRPSEPNSGTGSLNAIVQNGLVALTTEVELNNITIADGATLIVDPIASLTTYGNIFVNGSGSLRVRSSSTRYGSLIPLGNVFIDNGENLRYDRNVNTTSLTGGNDLIAAPFFGEDFGSFSTFNLDNIVFNPSDVSEKLFGPFAKSTGTYLTLDRFDDSGYILDAGIGYRAASLSDGTFAFKGSIALGTVDVPISISGPQYQEWNLIGNPYPSYLSLDEFLALNNDQFASHAAGIYGYDGDASNGWTIWNLAYSEVNPNAAITPGQGFLVASQALSGTVSFTPEMRTTGSSDDFILGRNEQTNYLQLSLKSNDKSYFTQLYFSPNASKGMDIGYDAIVYNYVAPSFAIYSQLIEENAGYDMAIQSVGKDQIEKIIFPIGLNALAGQQLTISLEDMNFSNNENVYLEDRLTNTFTLLNETDYKFTPNINLSGIGRFYLNVSQSTLSVENESLDQIKISYSKENQAILVNGFIKFSSKATVFDSQGRIVKMNNLQINSDESKIDVSDLSRGVYLVQIGSSSENKTGKIIIR